MQTSLSPVLLLLSNLQVYGNAYKGNSISTGGTRFIGVYLARDLINQGHEVTLLTRGKTPITSQIPDDTDATFKSYTDAIKHIAVDRKDESAVKEKLSSGGFEGLGPPSALVSRMHRQHRDISIPGQDAFYSSTLHLRLLS